jgi:hypothetical protein
MSKEQALHLLVADFQQQAEADGKWNQFTSPALFILLQATLKFMILEKDLKKEDGKFNLKQFQVLSYGSAQ